MNRLLTLGSFPTVILAVVIAAAVLLLVDGAALSSQLEPMQTGAAVQGDLPDVSIETASGTRTTLSATDGRVRIATMFYTHCPGVCPLTIKRLQDIEQQLPRAGREKLTVVMLSLDPTHDTPSQLRTLGINSTHWLIGRTSLAETAKFAKAVNIKYRALSDGSIDHSSSLVLLNEQGRVLARAGADDDLAAFAVAVRQAVRE